jgi:hypothetical protein
MSEARTYACPHCEREFKSEAAPGHGGIKCPLCQTVFQPKRAYLGNEPPPSPAAAPTAGGDGKPSGRRRWQDLLLSLILPGVDRIECRASECLLARLLLIVSVLSRIALFLLLLVAVLTVPVGHGKEATDNFLFALMGAGSSLVSAVLSYGFAQHFSHVAKTARYTERICQLLEKRDGR